METHRHTDVAADGNPDCLLTLGRGTATTRVVVSLYRLTMDDSVYLQPLQHSPDSTALFSLRLQKLKKCPEGVRKASWDPKGHPMTMDAPEVNVALMRRLLGTSVTTQA